MNAIVRDINPSRRGFLVGSIAGGLSIGLKIPAFAQQATIPEVNAWVVVKPDSTCVIRIARTEMGQGTLTGLAQLVAEELECDWRKVTTEQIRPGENLKRQRVWGEMGTGGSRGIRTSHDYVRRGGAAARIMLMQAAAAKLNVPVGELSVAEGVITHAASGRKVSYGEVAEAASKITPPDPKAIQLKDPKNWKVAGKPVKRLDTAEKLDGSKKYAIDIVLPGMLVAAVKDCPVFGGKVVSFDDSKLSGKAGFVKVVKVGDSGVAVVADSFWHAKTYLEQLPVVWDEAGNGDKSSATIKALLEEGLNSTGPNNGGRNEGDAPGAITKAAKKVEAVYYTPFLAHATMEPMNCIARVTAGKAEAWVPTQNAESSLAALSEASGVPLANCEVYRTDPGGGFGRRGGAQDYVRQAVQIAKQFPGVPIKMLWTREEDQGHDFFRPISMMKGEAGLDAQGNLVGLRIRISGQSINAWSNPGAIVGGKDERQLQGFWKDPGDAQFGYGVPNLLTEYMMRNTHVPVGPWRGVNTNQNGVYAECFMEEVARASGKDSLEFRRGLMKDFPKHLAVLNAAAEKGDWGKPLPQGHFRGIAQFMGYGSYSAAVAEVSLKADGTVRVHRMTLALNCGIGVNPDQIAAQVEGSVAYGLSATFYGECAVEKGRMVNLNFDKYEILRLADFPKVETVIVNTGDFWGGVGEPTICVVAPSVVNAVYAATGKPIRSLPLRSHKLA